MSGNDDAGLLLEVMNLMFGNGQNAVAIISNVIYQVLVKPVQVILSMIIWNPVVIIKRVLGKFAVVPVNAILWVFFRTSLQDLFATADVKSAFVIAQVCVQYTITTAVVGLILGLVLGALLGSLHRIIRVPVLYITVLPTYVERLFVYIDEISNFVRRISELGMRSIPLISNDALKEENSDSLFADLLDSYEYEYGHTEKTKIDNYRPLTPVSAPIDEVDEDRDSDRSNVSWLSNIWDSIQETGTVRTDIEELKNSSDRKLKGYSSGYYDKLHIEHLHHRK
ncbi:Ldb16p Ecym_1288 [Eremothecium cymbalariae DBVPG|uniref:Uncharacterized protein n=1 Tax=Eremothecium cymbalariae (strain CBS 270.75 / DBVPG 7215 / KCTC 17166 / NRRL Y-17582) TaxID=931890 RepID=G8JN63_ERECY|nr:hypothetical protein Ecym_1288 [Eremothecium cymbalariae DBVPG\